MTNTTPPNVGTFISNALARKIIYGTYAAAALIVGAVAVYFASIGLPVPDAVVGAQNVIAYLAIPIGGLALANVPSPEGNAI